MNLFQTYEKFPTQNDCLAYIEQISWSGKAICPYCKSKKSSIIRNQKKYHCNTCNCSYSVTVHTIFHKTRIDLQKWFFAINLLLNEKTDKTRITSRKLAKEIEVNRNTAWLMMQKIDRAMRSEQQRNLLLGIVKYD
ncbi:transposase [Nostoc sp.]